MTVSVSVALILLVIFLTIRNEPIADPNLVVLLRVVVALAVSSLGAVIPGFIHVDWRKKGILIRAGGAIALFIISYFFTPRVLQTHQVDNLSGELKDQFRLQSLKGDPISDFFFTISTDSKLNADLVGFRIMTERFGSFFFQTVNNTLQVRDRGGNTITSYPTIGSDLREGHAFFSIDFKQGRKAIPEHLLVHLTLADIEKASLDFMVKPELIGVENTTYSIAIGAVASGWIVSCGSFMLGQLPPERTLSVYGDFVATSPIARTFTLELTSNYSTAAAGEDLESHWISGLWSVINSEMMGIPEVARIAQWPRTPEEVHKLPISVPLTIAANLPLPKEGGKLGDIKAMLYRSSGTSGTIVVLVQTQAVIEAIWKGKAASTSPPQEMKEIAGFLLSFWKRSDELGRTAYTMVPLERIVILCPVGTDTWVWVLEGDELHSRWQPEWTSVADKAIALLREGVTTIDKCTTIWKRFPRNP